VSRRKERPEYLRTLGERIRIAREARDIDARYLANASHVSLTSLYQIERGENEPSLPTLIRISIEVGVAIDELVRDLVLPE
jgi:transcriptional regulator with XRE-family HTH domain